MTRILGIDPGSRATGFGIIEQKKQQFFFITSGCIRTKSEFFPNRLGEIYSGVKELVELHKPDQLAIEQVFMHKNADSALKLGQARGAAICAVLAYKLPVFEYSAREIKQALVGKGNAEKSQVQHMVKVLLGIKGELQVDAADALGVCLCHAHSHQTLIKLASGRSS